jgi:hypothetical protein
MRYDTFNGCCRYSPYDVSYNSDTMLEEMLNITVYVIPEADEKTLNDVQGYFN